MNEAEQQKKGTTKMKKLFITIFVVISGIIFWIYKADTSSKNIRSTSEERKKTTETIQKKLPENIKITIKKENSMEPSREVSKISLESKEKATIMNITLSEQSGFGSWRSNDGATYKITLYNTKTSKDYVAPNLDFENDDIIKGFHSANFEDDLILYFTLRENVMVTQLAFKGEDSNILQIKMEKENEKEKEAKNVIKMGEPKEEPSMTKIRSKRSATELSNEAYQIALQASNQGKVVEVAKYAKQALLYRADNHNARKLLILSLLQMQQIDAANVVLAKGFNLSPHNINFIKIKARMLIDDSKHREALNELLKVTPNIMQEPDYYAFIAALYQQIGEYKRSTKIYLRLIRAQPRNGSFLAGLAISTEKLGDKRMALQFYERALIAGGLKLSLQNYVQDRVTKLKYL